MASITIYPSAGAVSPVDGYTLRQTTNTVWSTLHNNTVATTATATSLTATLRIQASGATNRYEEIGRVMFLFDTSILGATAVISSAAIGFYSTSKANDWVSGIVPTLHVVSASPASNSDVVLADYPNYGTTSYGSEDYANINTFSYTDISLNALGIAAIDTSGISKFGLRWHNDMANIEPTWETGAQLRVNMYLADQTGTGNDPYLLVNYTTGTTTMHSAIVPSISIARRIIVKPY